MLGVPFDCGLSFTDQGSSIREKAKIRLAILAWVAGSTWASLVRYAVVLLGSGLFEEHLSPPCDAAARTQRHEGSPGDGEPLDS